MLERCGIHCDRATKRSRSRHERDHGKVQGGTGTAHRGGVRGRRRGNAGGRIDRGAVPALDLHRNHQRAASVLAGAQGTAPLARHGHRDRRHYSGGGRGDGTCRYVDRGLLAGPSRVPRPNQRPGRSRRRVAAREGSRPSDRSIHELLRARSSGPARCRPAQRVRQGAGQRVPHLSDRRVHPVRNGELSAQVQGGLRRSGSRPRPVRGLSGQRETLPRHQDRRESRHGDGHRPVARGARRRVSGSVGTSRFHVELRSQYRVVHRRGAGGAVRRDPRRAGRGRVVCSRLPPW